MAGMVDYEEVVRYQRDSFYISVLYFLSLLVPEPYVIRARKAIPRLLARR